MDEKGRLSPETQLVINEHVDGYISRKCRIWRKIVIAVVAVLSVTGYVTIGDISKKTQEAFTKKQIASYGKEMDEQRAVWQQEIDRYREKSSFYEEQLGTSFTRSEERMAKLDSEHGNVLAKLVEVRIGAEFAYERANEKLSSVEDSMARFDSDIKDAQAILDAIEQIGAVKKEIVDQVLESKQLNQMLQERVIARTKVMPIGSIVPFIGTQRDIDEAASLGWAICDGTDGTPDLRGRFLRGNDGILGIGALGGSASHTHSGVGLRVADYDTTHTGMGSSRGADGSHGHQLKIDESEHLPPYVQVVFLMKTN